MSARIVTMLQNLLCATLLGAAVTMTSAAAVAQDHTAAADAAATPDAAPSEAAEVPAGPPPKPRPAEIARLAANNLLLGVTCAGDTLVAVGDRGNILLSTDGKIWKQVPVPINATLTAVAFADARNGWAVGHDAAILHTVDGGNSWTLQHLKAGKDEPLLNVLAIDPRHAFAVGAFGTFLQTADGGATWTEVAAPAIRDDGMHLNGLVRLGDGSLFLVGETGLAGASADNGVSWERLTVPYEGSLFGALPRGEKGALVFGLRGNVLISDDVRAGTWAPVDIGSVQSMFGGTVLPDGRAVLVGADGVIVDIAADGTGRRATSTSGSLSGVVALADHLQIVGEAGVGRVAIAK